MSEKCAEIFIKWPKKFLPFRLKSRNHFNSDNITDKILKNSRRAFTMIRNISQLPFPGRRAAKTGCSKTKGLRKRDLSLHLAKTPEGLNLRKNIMRCSLICGRKVLLKEYLIYMICHNLSQRWCSTCRTGPL